MVAISGVQRYSAPIIGESFIAHQTAYTTAAALAATTAVARHARRTERGTNGSHAPAFSHDHRYMGGQHDDQELCSERGALDVAVPEALEDAEHVRTASGSPTRTPAAIAGLNRAVPGFQRLL